MENENRKSDIIRIVISVLLVVVSVIIEKNGLHLISIGNNNIDLCLIISLFAYLICGHEILIGAIKSLIGGDGFDENVLMTIASIGAFILGERNEAIAVIVFFKLGELFEDYSIDRSRDNIKALVDIKPEVANKLVNNDIKKISPEEIQIGDILVVNPHEKIPIDGEIIEGDTTLNTSMLTGESIPRYVTKGDTVSSGLINNDKIIKIKATKLYSDSTAKKIIDLIENSVEKKSKSENYIRSFAKVYTPIVCVVAFLTFVLPVAFEYIILKINPNISVWAYRALTVLVVSCPCAILISVPLAFYAGISSLSKLSVLVKGSNYIEALTKIKIFMFDKTGTMTKGVFEVVGVHHLEMKEGEFFRLVSHLEFFSNHPIAKSIIRYYGKDIDASLVKDVKEIGGRGLSGVVEGKKVLAGNDKLMKEFGVDYIDCNDVGTIVHVAVDNVYVGHILINDVIKENAEKAISMLKKSGVKKCVMLTGDREKIALDVAGKIGIDECHAALMPDDKLRIVEEVNAKERISFVGDGMNDAPCISRADVGIAMGNIGSDTAVDLADMVIMNDDIICIPKAYLLSKKVMRTVYENLIMSIGIKVLVLILSIFGISNMWLAVFSDVGIMILAVLNSVNLMNSYKKYL